MTASKDEAIGEGCAGEDQSPCSLEKGKGMEKMMDKGSLPQRQPVIRVMCVKQCHSRLNAVSLKGKVV